MKKLLFLSLLLSPFLTQAYNYTGNLADKYYSGQISTEEYVDSICPQKYESPATVKHSDGTWSRIENYPNGDGVIKNSDGSWSRFSR